MEPKPNPYAAMIAKIERGQCPECGHRLAIAVPFRLQWHWCQNLRCGYGWMIAAQWGNDYVMKRPAANYRLS